MNKPNDTYVGDRFALRFIRADKDPLQVLDGELGTLVGFTKSVQYVLEHETTPQIPYPGVYSCLGDAVLRLDLGRIVKVPLANLEPLDYSFDDFNVKNLNYQKEAGKYTYLGPLPFIPHCITDTVLVARHGTFPDDFIGQIVDIDVKGPRIFYMVSVGEDVYPVPQEKIIDVVELGDYSEMRRYQVQMKTLERMLHRQIGVQRHHDVENLEEEPIDPDAHDPERDIDEGELF